MPLGLPLGPGPCFLTVRMSSSLRPLIALALVSVLSSAVTPALAETTSTEDAVAEAVCAMPHSFLLRTWRGWRPDRGPEIQMIAKEPNFVGSGLPHVGPWDYVQHVPMFWFGPGQVAPAGEVARPVTSAGIAPTAAKLLGFPWPPRDGQAMREALLPEDQRVAPPKLIVTMIWDAAGQAVLDAHPDAWPFLASIVPDGAWYENATVGSSPTSTAQIHATIGTGAFPRNHALIGHRLRIGPTITTPWARGPAFIALPTLADLYDRAMGNEPKVGLQGTVSIHLGMLGHGKMWGGGDDDIAVVRQKVGGDTLGEEGFRWNLPPVLQPFFRFPAYTNSVPGFEEEVERVDRADGRLDGMWRDNDIDQLLAGFDTPARTPYQTRVVEEMIRREGFGADEVPDLLYVNYKEIDYISHVWTMNSPEMRDAVAAQDEALEDFVDFLNEEVGEGQWVILVTADHGAIPDPELTGAFQISTGSIAAGINSRFDTDGDATKVVQLVQPTGIFIDEGELRQNGSTLAEVAQWIMTMTKSQANPAIPVPAGEAGEKVFQAAFPSEMMADLLCLPEARA